MKGFFVFLVFALTTGCGAPRPTIEVGNYLLLDGGKQILGREKGLTCFFFENNQTRMPFKEFLVIKYNLGYTEDISYNVDIDGTRFKVFLYTNDELVKYYDLNQFMVSNVETEVNRVGSTDNFLGISVIDQNNNDCLADDSLFQKIVLKYLTDLKHQYNTY